MANEVHVALLRQGVDVWNRWREENPEVQPDLQDANLRGAKFEYESFIRGGLQSVNLSQANLAGAVLARANLTEANLTEANLSWANLTRANLLEANLTGADLMGAYMEEANLVRADLTKALLAKANLPWANLSGADLRGVKLSRANLGWANLEGANLEGAHLEYTNLGATRLRNTQGIDRCNHSAFSIVDQLTIRRSGKLPDKFLRGCGLPDSLIDYFPSLLKDPIQFYSCFISYSSKDNDFARRLHADLQDNGVRCWFAPEDLKIGERLGETIDEAIRVRDKLLLILSETSVASAWVTREVQTALDQEKQHGKTVLFPVRLDDAVLKTTEQWAHNIRRNRHIGDFRGWKNHDEYQKALERLFRDLKVEAK